MASCTQIEGMLQAYVDGELGHSDKVILRQHISECAPCGALLRKQERVCASLFETFADDRLRRDLTPGIMEHLPEMERGILDVQSVNWRVKHAVDHWGMIARVAPVAVGVVLVLVAVTLMSQWPRGAYLDASVIGVVTQSAGKAAAYPANKTSRQTVEVEDFVHCGEHFETGSNDTLMLTLAGPTQIKLNENTRVTVSDHRTLRLDSGQIWADVEHETRLFRVLTPVGGITVMGTVFDVAVDRNRATITVARGSVQVDNQAVFSQVEPGLQVQVSPADKTLVPKKADVAAVTAWAAPITPDQKADDLFRRKIKPIEAAAASPPYQVGLFFMDGKRTVKGVHLQWEPDVVTSGHCGYDLFVFEKRKPLFKGHVNGDVFDDKNMRSYEVPAPGEPIPGLRRLDIKVVPDRSTGSVETDFSEFSVSCI